MKAPILTAVGLSIIAFHSLAVTPPDPGFVTHEWGTFTSVQGADGVQMDWNPLVAPDLPKFVYDFTKVRRKPRFPAFSVAGKTAITCTQRLETPVIYFYSDRTRTIDVTVAFPRGSVTEWYPLESATDTGASTTIGRADVAAGPALHWGKMQVLAGDTKGVQFPVEKSGSHYYAARDTDSNALQVTTGEKSSEAEKFLFYRGVGSFTAPLTIKLESSDSRQVTLANTSREILRNLFLYAVGDSGGDWIKVEHLLPGERRIVALPTNSAPAQLTGLASELRKALIGEGLYEREAAAMVKTWETSWFSEKGMRVLYTLPRAWTDRTLPLRVTPTPRETARVMVGRAEIITPEMELALVAATERYVAAWPGDRPAIAAEARNLGLGRFMQPTLMRVMASAKRSNEFSSLSWELLQGATFPPKTEAPPASN